MSARTKRGQLVPLDDVTVAHYYTRVSGNEQWEEGLSLAQQPTRCKDYIGRLPRAIVGQHFQDVLTGKRNDRKEYQRMLMTIRGLAMEGKRQLLVVPAFDRFGRNMLERVRAYEELEDLGVTIHSIREGGVVQKFVYDILAAAAAEEARQLGVRLQEINAGLAAQGWPKPGKAAWGFTRRPRTPEEQAGGAPRTLLALHEVEADYVTEAWDRYARGASIRSIAIWAGGLPATARGGRNLGFNSIRQLFRAPIYVARLGSYDDDDPASILDRPVARVPRMVSDETWSQAVLSRRMAERVPRQASGAYRLTGLLYCWKCGSRMSGRHKPAQSGYGKEARFEYICNSGKTLGADQDGRRCSSTVLLEQIETAVLDLVRLVLDYASRSQGRAELSAAWEDLNRSERHPSAAGRLAKLETERAGLVASQINASRKFVDDQLSRQEFDDLKADLAQQIDAVDQELGRLRGLRRTTAAPMALEPMLATLTTWRDALDSEHVPAVREALATLLRRVVPKRTARGRYEADVTFTSVGMWLLAAAALSSGREDLVSVYHTAKARWSTETITTSPRALLA